MGLKKQWITTCFSEYCIHLCESDPFPVDGSGHGASGADTDQTLYSIWSVILSALVASTRCFWGDVKAGYPQRLPNPRHRVLGFCSETGGTVTWASQYLAFPQLSEASMALDNWLFCPKRCQTAAWILASNETLMYKGCLKYSHYWNKCDSKLSLAKPKRK